MANISSKIRKELWGNYWKMFHLQEIKEIINS